MERELRVNFRAVVAADEGRVTTVPVPISADYHPFSVDLTAGDTDFVAISMRADRDYSISALCVTPDLVVPELTLYDTRGNVLATSWPIPDAGYGGFAFDAPRNGQYYLGITAPSAATYDVNVRWEPDGAFIV